MIDVLLLVLACWLSAVMVAVRPSVRVRRAVIVAAAERSWFHEQGDDHLRGRPRNEGCDPRGRSGCRSLHRTRAQSWRSWQRLQGPGLQGAARHAVVLR